VATATENHTDQSMSSLVAGIVGDIQDLLKQQIALTRREITDDLRKSKQAAGLLTIGGSLLFLSTIMLSLTAVYLLHWLSSPAGSDPASVPLWGCYAIVGAVFLALGVPMIVAGKKEFDSVHLLATPTNPPAGSTTHG
jgi:hypothetical protein